MYRLLIIIFLFIFYNGLLQAEIVNQLKVEGNKRVSSDTIRIYGDIDLNKDYSERIADTTRNNSSI